MMSLTLCFWTAQFLILDCTDCILDCTNWLDCTLRISPDAVVNKLLIIKKNYARGIVLFKLTTNRHEASGSLLATAELR